MNEQKPEPPLINPDVAVVVSGCGSLFAAAMVLFVLLIFAGVAAWLLFANR